MKQDEIIKMAREARLGTTLTHSGEVGHFINGANFLEELERFAKMVADKVSRELGLNYEDQETIEIEYRLKAQEDDVENTLHWHALNYRTALTENAQEMFEALENYVREKINENNQERKKLVGLTVEEIKECKFQSVNGTGWSTDIDIDQLAKNIESALKQKNGYAEENT
jgi:NTP pyrophosphatase (non-canonical NTP hydrolase)